MGQMGAFLARALARSGQDVTAIWSRDFDHADDVAQSIPRCRATVIPQSAVDNADLIFITTPDAAIEPFACSLAWWRGQSVVHCSGALDRQVLSAAAEGRRRYRSLSPSPIDHRGERPRRFEGCCHHHRSPASHEGQACGHCAIPGCSTSYGGARSQGPLSRWGNHGQQLSRDPGELRCGASAIRRAFARRRDRRSGFAHARLAGERGIARPDECAYWAHRPGDIVTVQRHLDALAGTPEIADIYRCLADKPSHLLRRAGDSISNNPERLFQILDEYHSHERTAPCA